MVSNERHKLKILKKKIYFNLSPSQNFSATILKLVTLIFLKVIEVYEKQFLSFKLKKVFIVSMIFDNISLFF